MPKRRWPDARPLLCAAVLASGCGGGLRGTYVPPDGEGFLDQITFRSGGKADITFMGTTREATWAVDGRRLTITSGGDTQVFTIDDDGCVDGGRLIGRYCREGRGNATAPEDVPAGLSGRYETDTPMGTLALDFRRGNRVRVIVSAGGAELEARDGTWEAAGNRVTVRIPDDDPLELTRRGNALEAEASFFGEPVTFRRK